MFCKKCGFKLGDDVNFCPKCGTMVSDSVKERLYGADKREESDNNDISFTISVDGDKYIRYHTDLHNAYKAEAIKFIDSLDKFVDIAVDLGESTIIPFELYKDFERKINRTIDIMNMLILILYDSDQTVAKCGIPNSHDVVFLMNYWEDLMKTTGRIKEKVLSIMTECLNNSVTDWEVQELIDLYDGLKQAFLSSFSIISLQSYKLYNTIKDENFDLKRYIDEREKLQRRIQSRIKSKM